MKIIIIVISVILFSNSAFSQKTWQKSYGTPSTDFPRQMIALSKGGYLFTGQSYTTVPGIYHIAYLARTNSIGDTLWSKEIFPTKPDSGIVGLSVYEVSSNEYLLGCSKTLIMYDSMGNIQWSKKLNTSFYQILDYRNAEIVYTTGSRLLKIDTSGIIKLTYNFPNFYGTKKAIKNAKGNFCYLYPNNGSVYFKEVNFNGQIVRDQLIGAGSNINNGILIQNSKSQYVEAHGGAITYVIKFDTALNIISDNSYNGFNELRDISETPDNGYILTGKDDDDIIFLKIDSNNQLEYIRWLVRWFYEEVAVDIHVDTDGGFVVFGSGGRAEPNFTDYLLVKTNSDASLSTSFLSNKKPDIINVYPNPVKDKIHINSISNINGELKLFDYTGKLILEKKIEDIRHIEVTISSIPKGIYTLQIVNQNKMNPYFGKILKE